MVKAESAESDVGSLVSRSLFWRCMNAREVDQNSHSVRLVLSQAHRDVLKNIWDESPRVPSLESQHAWATANDAPAARVHDWFSRRKTTSKRKGQPFHEGTYNMSVPGWASCETKKSTKVSACMRLYGFAITSFVLSPYSRSSEPHRRRPESPRIGSRNQKSKTSLCPVGLWPSLSAFLSGHSSAGPSKELTTTVPVTLPSNSSTQPLLGADHETTRMVYVLIPKSATCS
jgi:hypothetical protein